MITKAALLATILLSSAAQANCWLINNLHGRASMSGDNYDFIEDGTTGSVFKLIIDGKNASVVEINSGYKSDMSYTAMSNNTIVGMYEAGGGITVETWSITTDKKVLYSKVMNTPGIQMMTSTKSFVGDVIGNCKI